MLSSVNLPGGIQRKRNTTDELQIRTFFSEGDLLVAEVQTLFQDGQASLHTRSLKYGKLRNGVFMAVAAGTIRRMKTHILTISTANGGGEVDVVLGVNGYIFIAKHIVNNAATSGAETTSITRIEEEVVDTMYSNVNDEIGENMRKEIGRLMCVIRAMVKWGLKIDDSLGTVYETAVELDVEGFDWDNGGPEGEAGRKLVQEALAKLRME